MPRTGKIRKIATICSSWVTDTHAEPAQQITWSGSCRRWKVGAFLKPHPRHLPGVGQRSFRTTVVVRTRYLCVSMPNPCCSKIDPQTRASSPKERIIVSRQLTQGRRQIVCPVCFRTGAFSNGSGAPPIQPFVFSLCMYVPGLSLAASGCLAFCPRHCSGAPSLGRSEMLPCQRWPLNASSDKGARNKMRRRGRRKKTSLFTTQKT